ncbi:MAG: adenosylmethionine-8-amino-7-oxononanoate aminotransferase [Crocinitomix sp.]|jgi:adenosylmethionine-8-amino-7-oxononanoate aminotransferase
MIQSLIHSMVVCPDMSKTYSKIDYGKGIYLYDQLGKRYLDGSSGSAAVANIGHGRQEIAEVLREQASKVSILPTHAFSAEIVETYLEKLTDFAPEGFNKAWTTTSGTGAVENAVKLALQHHQVRGNPERYKIISRWHTYHGNSVFMLDVGGMKKRRESYKNWFQNFPHISPAFPYRKPQELTEIEYVAQLLKEFEQCLIDAKPETVAAFIAEPVVAAALGAVAPPEGYFIGIKMICEKYGILFISDEILAGFGRTGKNFGIENFGIVPDIIASGKGISGGYFPLSAVLASEKVMAPFVDTNSPFLGGHTFACNPLGAAVGLKVLEIYRDENLVENAGNMGAVLLKKLERLQDFEMVGDIRGIGLLCGVEIVENRETKAAFPRELNISKRIGEKSLEKGVVLYPGSGTVDGTLGDHVLITPPLTINENQLDEIVDVLYDCLLELQNELLL